MHRLRAHVAPRSATLQPDVWTWLLRLRWGACFGQALATLVAGQLLAVAVPTAWLLGIVAAAAASNGALRLAYARRQEPPTTRVVTAVLLGDVAVLTALLALTCGQANPFVAMYTVPLALAATVLPGSGVAVVVAASAVGFASLAWWYRPLAPLEGALALPLYVTGLRWSVAVTAAFLAYFLGRIQLTLAASERRLARAREQAVRDAQVTGLATLAAGAAHELATPLATIAVVAGEMARKLAGCEDRDALASDTAVIRAEVGRCRDVLRHMGAEAAAHDGGALDHVAAADLVHEALRDWTQAGRVALRVDPAARGALHVPRHSVVHSLRAVVHNALDATEARAPAASGRASGQIAVRVAQVDGTCYISVADEGCGMDGDALARAGQPFYTTKGPGRGMGLGLFLARDLCERLGGALRVDSRRNCGTTVILQLPLAPTVDHPRR